MDQPYALHSFDKLRWYYLPLCFVYFTSERVDGRRYKDSIKRVYFRRHTILALSEAPAAAALEGEIYPEKSRRVFDDAHFVYLN